MRFVTASVCALLLAATSIAGFAADTKPEAKAEADMKAAEKQLQEANKRLEQAAREVAELSSKVSRQNMPDNFVFLGRNPNRAVLGIGIGGSHETEIDDGVAVLSVSPEGPAAKAGIKTGDVIVELNGKSMKRDKEDSPSEKLLDSMGKLAPGDEVTVKYLREGKPAIVKLKADRLSPAVVRRDVRAQGIPGQRYRIEKDDFDFDFDLPHGFVGMTHGGLFANMELVPLTPKLAQYFGTDKGLLIVRAPESKELKLEDGDVLVDVDGRVPSNPGHAFRILGSYQSGEKLTLNVLRQRKKTVVAITVPEHEQRAPRPPRPPRSPTAPIAPAPVPAPAAAPMPPPV